MKIVLDTNVLVSGLLHADSYPGAILRLVAAGEIRILYDARIFIEYKEVLLREKFSFDREWVEVLLDEMESDGILVTARPLTCSLPDPDDAPFLEIASSLPATPLVTGNRRHFPRSATGDVPLFSPKEFIQRFYH